MLYSSLSASGGSDGLGANRADNAEVPALGGQDSALCPKALATRVSSGERRGLYTVPPLRSDSMGGACIT